MDKLNFLTAGLPLATGNKGYESGLNILKELKLDGLELEFVHGVRISEQGKTVVKQSQLIKTAHAPFYINLNSKEEEKIEASVERIIETANTANELNAYSITFHAGFYMGDDKETTYKKIQQQVKKIENELTKTNNKIWIRPETTGKSTQWGDLDEVIRLSKDFEYVLPCIDFSHLHARYNGEHNTYDEFSRIIETIGNELGSNALENFHAHLAGIDYSSKGEKRHLNLKNSDMNYKSLLQVLKTFDIRGVLVCESPNIEEDCILLKEYYHTL